MEKFIITRTNLIILGALFLIINAVFWPITAVHISLLNTGYWVAYGFMCFAFVVPMLCTFLPSKSRNASGARAPFFFSAAIYLMACFITNLVAWILNSPRYVLNLSLNLVWFLLLIIALVVFYRFYHRVSQNEEVRETRMENWRMVSVEVTSLRTYTNDPEIIKAINALRDNVNNSSSASNQATAESEKEFKDQLAAIRVSLKNGGSKEEVLKQLEMAENILKTRNQMFMAARRE